MDIPGTGVADLGKDEFIGGGGFVDQAKCFGLGFESSGGGVADAIGDDIDAEAVGGVGIIEGGLFEDRDFVVIPAAAEAIGGDKAGDTAAEIDRLHQGFIADIIAGEGDSSGVGHHMKDWVVEGNGAYRLVGDELLGNSTGGVVEVRGAGDGVEDSHTTLCDVTAQQVQLVGCEAEGTNTAEEEGRCFGGVGVERAE